MLTTCFYEEEEMYIDDDDDDENIISFLLFLVISLFPLFVYRELRRKVEVFLFETFDNWEKNIHFFYSFILFILSINQYSFYTDLYL